MTATTVNGHTVLADEPARSSLVRRDGKPVFFTQLRTLLLDNESTVFGCAHCDFTDERIGRVRSHVRYDHTDSDGPAPTRKTKRALAAAGDMSLGEALAKLAEVEQLTAERDEWKRKARKAQAELATIRRVLGR